MTDSSATARTLREIRNYISAADLGGVKLSWINAIDIALTAIAAPALRPGFDPTLDDVEHLRKDYLKDITPEVRARIIMERAVIRKAVTDILRLGHAVRVWDGENYATSHISLRNPGNLIPGSGSHDTLEEALATVMGEVCACDEEWIDVYEPRPVAAPAKGYAWKFKGQIALVYGNDGYDVIADYHICLDELLAGSNLFADNLANELPDPTPQPAHGVPYPFTNAAQAAYWSTGPSSKK